MMWGVWCVLGIGVIVFGCKGLDMSGAVTTPVLHMFASSMQLIVVVWLSWWNIQAAIMVRLGLYFVNYAQVFLLLQCCSLPMKEKVY